MTHIVVGRKTNGQQIGLGIVAKFFVRDSLFRESDQQVVRERRVVESFVERPARRRRAAGDHVWKIIRVVRRLVQIFPGHVVFAGARQILGLSQQPIPVRAEETVSHVSIIEARHPVRHLIEVVGAGNHISVVGAEPVSGVRAPSGGKNRRTILG